MNKVRFGVVGLGNMGVPHARHIVSEGGRRIVLTAVCDREPGKQKVAEELGVPFFTDAQEMYDSGLIDAVIIAVPHYWHAPLTIRAARKKIHVLCEKPMSSSVGHARLMVAECKKRKVVLGAMLQQRTRKIMQKIKQLVDAGRIGEVFRVQMICSNWFRTQHYYDSGAWRGTWDGEGGGVLINQAPHSLDLFQWIGLGLPKRITASVETRDHKIEVEDTANVICDYGDGRIGYIYATTAEEPGLEQFMLVGDKGTIISEGGTIKLGKLKMPVSKHIYTSKSGLSGRGEQTTTWTEVKYAKDPGKPHWQVIKAFANHLLDGKALVATGEEALAELEISNAAYIAGYKSKVVDMPVKEAEMESLLSRLVRERATGKGGNERGKALADLRKLMKK
jgi:predicted dehydrogenase